MCFWLCFFFFFFNLVNQNLWFNVSLLVPQKTMIFVLAAIWKQVSYATVETSGPLQFYSFNTYLFRQIFYFFMCQFYAFFFFQKSFYFSPVFKLTNTYRESSFCMLLTLTNFTYQSLVILVPQQQGSNFSYSGEWTLLLALQFKYHYINNCAYHH